jgi:hypothetical protein
VKYPLRGALTEYQKDIESWRGLPFSAGSFLFALAGSLLQSLPAGLSGPRGWFGRRNQGLSLWRRAH